MCCIERARQGQTGRRQIDKCRIAVINAMRDGHNENQTKHVLKGVRVKGER